MESYYEINVAKLAKHSGKKQHVHFFATAPRSIKDPEQLAVVLLVFQEKFPKPEYVVSATHYQCVGTTVSV